MIEYLEKLVEDGEYQKALELAERLLLNSDCSLEEMMRVNAAMQWARFFLKEYHGSIVSGQLAQRLARDTEKWDSFGWSCLLLAVSNEKLGQYQEAAAACMDYLYSPASSGLNAILDGRLWYNFGIILRNLGDNAGAVRAFETARKFGLQLGDSRFVHGVNHALISTLIAAGEHREVPRLLAACATYLRVHGDNPEFHSSRLWNLILRARFALATQRYVRAISVANRGLRLSSVTDSELIFQFLMILSKAEFTRGQVTDALAYALSARVSAIRAHRYDLEQIASNYLYELTQNHPDAVMSVSPLNLFPSLDFNLFPRQARN